MAFDRQKVADRIATLARGGLYVGTSSWKYPGWLGQLYSEDRYLYRGKVAQTRFNNQCLQEYAEVFKSVCVDAGYYQFPQPKTLEKLTAQVPTDFLFSFKVTEEITTKRFTRLPRYGSRAGQENPNFLNADLFQSAFLAPLAPHRSHIGVLIFEFSHFYERDFQRGRFFIEALDQFLGALPSDWQYGIEIRNKSLLHQDYFAVLSRHRVAHIYNQWQRMPPVEEQMALPGSRTTDFTGARLLLTPGRDYQGAVDAFSPYTHIQAPDPQVRRAAARLAEISLAHAAARPSVIYVNNRLEGNALETISAILDEVSPPGAPPEHDPPKGP